MFVELMPLLAGRTVMITVAREDDKAVRICIEKRRGIFPSGARKTWRSRPRSLKCVDRSSTPSKHAIWP